MAVVEIANMSEQELLSEKKEMNDAEASSQTWIYTI